MDGGQMRLLKNLVIFSVCLVLTMPFFHRIFLQRCLIVARNGLDLSYRDQYHILPNIVCIRSKSPVTPESQFTSSSRAE
jgi:hypothetical protein